MTAQPVIEVAGKRYTGSAIEIRQPVDPNAVVEAITGSDERESTDAVSVSVPAPPPVYAHIAHIHDEMGLRIQTALAKAARTVGGETPYDESLATARATLTELTPEAPGSERHRHKLETKTVEAERLKEQAATLRGEIRTRRKHDLPTETAQAELRDVLAALSEAETSAQAAKQQLTAAQEAMREFRDQQEHRFRLEERVANLERKARASLVEQFTPAFRAHVREIIALAEREGGIDKTVASGTLPTAERSATPLTAINPTVAALALVRFASFDTPVVLSGSLVESARAAAEILDAAVIRI